MMLYTYFITLLSVFVIMISSSEYHLTYASTDKTCILAHYRRKPCGYKYISQAACQLRGCCFHSSSIRGVPKCYKAERVNAVESCFPSEKGRQPCGYRYISQYQCQLRGCCFKTARSFGVPSCYKPLISFLKSTITSTTPVATTEYDPPLLRSAHGEERRETNVMMTPEKTKYDTAGDDSVSTSLLEMFLQMNAWQNANRSCSVKVGSRNDCGHPGITKASCESKNCCWDHSTLHSHWCFYPVWRSLESHNRMNDYTSSGSESESPSDEYMTIEPNDSTGMYQPPVPTTAYDEYWDTTSSIDNITDAITTETSSTVSTDTHSSALVTTKNIVITAASTTTTEVLPPYEDSVDPPVKDDEVVVYSRENVPNTTPYSPQTTTSTTTTTTAMPATESHNNEWNNMIKLLNYYSVIQRGSKPSKVDRGLTNTCSATTSSCCLSNPKAPCCEYSIDAQVAYRRSTNPQSRIVGGGIAGHLRASVAYLTVKNFASQFCGGTLIMSNWIVTAAHCVVEYCNGNKPVSEILVKLGKTDKSNFIRGKYEQIIPASKVICHSHNCKSTNQPRLNDIALVKLSRNIKRTMYVSPAALPYHGEMPVMNRKCIVLGWGETRDRGPKSNILKEVDVPLYSNQQCNKPDWRNCAVRACMMCAGELNADACEGDSGGPLFCQRPGGLYVLHGVYSWGRCGAEAKKPAVYTRFPYYVNWIKRQIYSRS
uniref:integumentary mucin C.1-like n=1 Tax=Styela clava TaxID=7725 RepID=UPI001939EFD3|nr:integumentary mucin C.1-like [Styela clava]